MHVIDWYPTICEMVGITATPDLDGQSFYRVITDGDYTADEHRWLLLDYNSDHCEEGEFCGALRWDEWKLISVPSANVYDDAVYDATDLCEFTWCSNMDTDYYSLNSTTTTSVYCPNVDMSTQHWNTSISSNMWGECAFNGKPCLFNMLNDPCEFHDKYSRENGVYTVMLQKALEYVYYAKEALRILNAPDDPSDIIRNGFWSPWKNTSDMIMFTNTTEIPTWIPTQIPTNFPTAEPIEFLHSTEMEETEHPTMYPTPSPTPHPTPAPVITLAPSDGPTLQPTFIPTKDPTLEPTVQPSKAPTTIRATEVPSKDESFMSTFYTATILSIVGVLCGVCAFYWYARQRNASKSRHRRLEDSLKGIEFRKVLRKPGGGEYAGLL